MVPESIVNDLNKFHDGIEIRHYRHASGGCINNGGLIKTNRGDFFIKWNDAGKYPLMFEAEFKGLNLLRETNTLLIPEPLFTGEAEGTSYILMEHIGSSGRNTNFFEELGEGLAKLHRSLSSHFGLDHDNYIGSLPQYNNQTDSWAEFFRVRRLEPQLQMAVDNGLMNQVDSKNFNKLFLLLADLFPTESPSLLHGDLWSGNYMVSGDGRPCLIDPAVYYGHREMDIAFSRLFGGFDSDFYTVYNETYPQESGFEDRLDVYNLYPLLVHVNLFGSSYLGQVRSILQRFC